MVGAQTAHSRSRRDRWDAHAVFLKSQTRPRDFSKNPELIDKAKENAGKSKKDRLAALKNASKDDNINNCKPK
jgi:hypothetical protein